MYAAWQADLLADPTKWAPSLSAGYIYATAPSKTNTWAGAAEVRKLLSERGLRQVPLASPRWDVAHLFALE